MRVGIDLGGTKIEAVVLSDAGEVLSRQRVPTPAQSYRGILDAIAGLLADVELQFGRLERLGIGTPGAESWVDGLMKNCNTTCLNGRPLRQDLRRHLGREVYLANDANCFALSEAVDGAAAQATSVFGVILGTGVGGGLVFNQRLHVGGNAIGGEWGHNPMPGAAEGRACYCGRRDCIETYLSGAGLLASYRQLAGRQGSGAVDAVPVLPQPVLPGSVPELVAMAGDGNAVAEAALEQYCAQLARALAVVVNIVDPEVIVLGGGLSNISALYQRVPKLWRRWVFSDDCRTALRPAKFGDSSGVRGAAWL